MIKGTQITDFIKLTPICLLQMNSDVTWKVIDTNMTLINCFKYDSNKSTLIND